MDAPRVEQGRLTEAPTPGATGMERRAFGEFVSGRGELASYALGWATDADPHVGRITVGIGAGNEGGGTFHAAVVPDEDGGFFFSLVDEVLADVPEGGPHLTAEAAKSHDTLPFIWFVVDTVMAQDRRAAWMVHWLLGTPALATPQVTDRVEPVLYVVHAPDDDHDLWQLIGSTDVGPASEAQLVHLHHALDEDATLCEVLDLEAGWAASRDAVGAPWSRLPAN